MKATLKLKYRQKFTDCFVGVEASWDFKDVNNTDLFCFPRINITPVSRTELQWWTMAHDVCMNTVVYKFKVIQTWSRNVCWSFSIQFLIPEDTGVVLTYIWFEYQDASDIVEAICSQCIAGICRSTEVDVLILPENLCQRKAFWLAHKN